MRSGLLYRTIAILIVGIALILLFGHDPTQHKALLVSGFTQAIVGVIAGFAIGTVAALMGVAGGELLIPTIVLLFGIDLKVAGSLSLAVSLPTMLVGFARHSRDRSFSVLGENRAFLFLMAGGSVGGAFAGGQLLGFVPSNILLPILAAILVISAVKVSQHS